jgi:hypothetical protein
MDMKPAGITAEGTFTPDLLIGGDHPIRTEGVTLEAEAKLVRGTLVYLKNTEQSVSSYDGGTITAGTRYGILVEDEDTTTATGTGATKSVMVYVAGDFNTNAITIASGTLETLRDALAMQSLYLRDPVVA